MTLPGDLSTCVCTGTFLAPDGQPLHGTVTFTPSAPLADPGGSVMVWPVSRRYDLSGGSFSATLLGTDASQIVPQGWNYLITIELENSAKFSFNSYLPSADSPLDISELTPLEPVTQMGAYLSLSGGTMLGPLYAAQNPASALEVATLGYVASVTAGLAAKAPCQEATAAALPANTYNGTALTLTADMTGALTVDGVAVSAGDRVLVKDESAQANNGIYVATSQGSSMEPYILTRSADMDEDVRVPGAYAFTEQGTVNSGVGYIVAGTGPYTLGTTAITWVQLTSVGDFTAGAGISLSGNEVSLVTPVSIGDGGTGAGTGVPAAQNDVFAGPASGGSGAPSFRALTAADVPVLNQNTTGTAGGLSATLAVTSGGTGQASAQAAINALTGAQSAGKYLRSDGTNASLAAIQAADVPALNQNTTGTAAGLSATLATGSGGTGVAVPAPSGDVTGATDHTALAALISAAPSGSAITLNASAPYYISAALSVSKPLAFYGNAEIIQVTSNAAGIVVTSGGFTWDGPSLTGPQYAASHISESAITVTGPSAGSPLSYVRIRNSSVSSWGAYGIRVQYANDVAVTNNDIYDIQYAGCQFLSVTGGQFTGNRVDSVVGSAANSGNCYGVSITEASPGTGLIDPSCENIAVTGNVITGVPKWTGIDMHSGTNITISGNIVQGCNFGIIGTVGHDGAGTQFTACHRVKITGNVVDIGALGNGQGTYGIVVSGAVNGGVVADYATGVSVTGNEVHGYAWPYQSPVGAGGITAYATRGLVITGNTFYGCSPAAVVLYNDNYGFAVGPNTITDCWDTLGHAGAIWLPQADSTGTISPQTVCNAGTVQAQAVIDAASVGQNVSSVTTLTLDGIGGAQVFASSGSVTVPASTGTATLAYAGTTTTTLTGVTLTSGSGTISAGFAQQTPAYINVYGVFNGNAANSVTYYRGQAAVTTETDDAYGGVFIPNYPHVYGYTGSAVSVTVPYGTSWLDAAIIGAGCGGTGGGSAALSGGVSAQAGGGGGGSGSYSQTGWAITAAMWGGTITVTVQAGSAGGAGGGASSGASGNAGSAGAATSSLTKIAGTGATAPIAASALGGGQGAASPGNSTAAVAGGTYGQAPGTSVTVTSPGQGGAAGPGAGGAVGVGAGGGGGGGGGTASATLGGGAGGAGGAGAGGAAGAAATSGTAAGAVGQAATIAGAGGGGGGGGAPGGAGGNGGHGGNGQVTLTWR